jgi:hypothetical protein
MTEWISVKIRLPEKHKKYLVRTFGKPSYYLPPIEKIEILKYDGKGIGQVTHWAELPEPPKEDS